MVYQWKRGARVKADAQKIGEELSQIGESITPENVVFKAKSKKSELHKCFEWDDSKAADEYRLVQAREIMRSIVEVESIDGGESTTIEIRAYESIVVQNDEGENKRVYVPTRQALTDPEMREQVFERLNSDIREAETTADKYKAFFPVLGEVKRRLEMAREPMFV